MNAAHIHLFLNHVTVITAIFSALLILLDVIKKNDTIRNLAIAGFVLAAITAIPVFLTGEPASEIVERIPGVAESTIEAHEEFAEFSIWIIEIVGIIALASLVFQKVLFFKTQTFSAIMVVFSIISSSAISYTGYLGGKIRHTEISGNTNIQNGQQGTEQGGKEDDD